MLEDAGSGPPAQKYKGGKIQKKKNLYFFSTIMLMSSC